MITRAFAASDSSESTSGDGVDATVRPAAERAERSLATRFEPFYADARRFLEEALKEFGRTGSPEAILAVTIHAPAGPRHSGINNEASEALRPVTILAPSGPRLSGILSSAASRHPVCPFDALAPESGEGDAVFAWDPPGGPEVIGWGASRRIDVEGPGRFGEVKAWGGAIASRLSWLRYPEAENEWNAGQVSVPPGRGGNEPAHDGQGSSFGSAPHGGEGSARDGERSARGGERFARGGEGSARGGERFARGGERSAQGGERSAQGGERSAQGGERLARGGEGSPRGGEGSALPSAQHGIVPPRFFGGFGFEDAPAGGDWKAFGAGSFVLPRWTHVRSKDREPSTATLTLTASGDEAQRPSFRARALDELDRILTRLEAPATLLDQGPVEVSRVEEEPQSDWCARIQAILGAIAQGKASKVVAARSTLIETRHPISPSAVYRRLGEHALSCARFMVLREGTAFVGATPERLVEVEGDRVWSGALAGSAAIPDAAALMADKEAREHRFVVEHVRALLDRFATDLIVPERPEVQRLRHVLHLFTPIAGRLRAPFHVLDIAEALHPTPAVAGVPTTEAFRIIQATERPRGWYAGPVGWFDGAGNGQFFVALRCGLIRGTGALVFAGAGIVEGSDPACEYRETALKALTLRRALGDVG